MRFNVPRALSILALLLSTGCIDRVAMQMRYDSQRDDCRKSAESALDREVDNEEISGNNIKSREDGVKSRELASHFSECMEEGGWTIATPSHNSGPTPVPVPVPLPNGSPVGPKPGVDYTQANGSQYPGQVNPGPATAALRRQPDASAPAPSQTRPMPSAVYTVPAGKTAAPARVEDDAPSPSYESDLTRSH